MSAIYGTGFETSSYMERGLNFLPYMERGLERGLKLHPIWNGG